MNSVNSMTYRVVGEMTDVQTSKSSKASVFKSSLQNKLLTFLLRTAFRAEYAVLNSLFRCKHGMIFLCKGTSQQYGNIPCVLNAMRKGISVKTIDEDCFTFANTLSLARAKVVVRDQSSAMLSGLRKDPSTIAVQLWHSGGWYKKVAHDAYRPGYAKDDEERRVSRIHGITDYMIISDEKLVPHYARAFRLSEDRVLPLGLPRTDSLLARVREEDRAALDARFPQLTGKRLLLYAPTWRADWHAGVRFQATGPDLAVLHRKLGEQWAFCWRIHPTLRGNSIPSGWLDVSAFEQDFCLSVMDALVTDYSSILFDFALLDRPVYLFTPDRNAYVTRERGLYLEPEELAPAAVAGTAAELAALVAGGRNVSANLRQQFMSACDGHSTERVATFLRGLAL